MAGSTFANVKTLSGKSIPSALGPTIGIKYYSWLNLVVLGDKDTNDVNPWVVNSKRNIDAGNSIVHGISFVLRPMDLPPHRALTPSLSPRTGGRVAETRPSRIPASPRKSRRSPA